MGEAIRLAEKAMPPSLREFGRDAVRCGRRVGGRKSVASPRQEFDFLAAVAEAPQDAGRAVQRLGLWPLAGTSVEAARLLSQSSLMVEKLLLPPASTPSVIK
jgi:hypothetical protein